MNLLTQEEGAALKVGDVVDVAWFTPRKPKGEVEPFSRQWDGRQEWLESVWPNKVVDSEPYLTASDGYAVKLKGNTGFFCVSRMQKQ